MGEIKGKLSEEVGEFLDDESNEELADVLEVIKFICKYKNLKFDELNYIRRKKIEQRGSFDKRIILGLCPKLPSVPIELIFINHKY